MQSMWLRVFPIFLLLLALYLPAQAKDDAPQHIYLVTNYSYDPKGTGGDPDLGHSLCGTRCNALASDYRNYTMSTGMRLTRVEANKQLRIDLKNPFMGGDCICVVDEYLVRINELYYAK